MITGGIWSEPLFWVGVYFLGYIIAILGTVHHYTSLYSQGRKALRLPTMMGSIIVVLLIVVPPLALPFTSQPRLSLSTPLALMMGMPILMLSGVIVVLAFKELTSKTAWTGESKELVTRGIYGIIRHPNYLANSLFPVGWAVIFKATYALYFTPLWLVSYLILIFPEERMLIKSYGESYREYKRRVPWRMIPKLF